MVHRRTGSAGLFLLAQLTVVAVFWIGLLAVYVLENAVNRAVELLNTISQQLTMTLQKEGADGDGALETKASEMDTSCRSSPKTPCGQAAMQKCASTGT